MLFLTLHSSTAAEVPKVLQVVEETKRRRHKAGTSSINDVAFHANRLQGFRRVRSFSNTLYTTLLRRLQQAPELSSSTTLQAKLAMFHPTALPCT
jgi:hypothetical protein